MDFRYCGTNDGTTGLVHILSLDQMVRWVNTRQRAQMLCGQEFRPSWAGTLNSLNEPLCQTCAVRCMELMRE